MDHCSSGFCALHRGFVFYSLIKANEPLQFQRVMNEHRQNGELKCKTRKVRSVPAEKRPYRLTGNLQLFAAESCKHML
jgi:hypothetical protein